MSGILMRRLHTFINLPFAYHLAVGIVIRLSLIFYAQIHDQFNDLKYTDVDYTVFTDAARHVVDGESPYRRHTYRYSPIIALILTPNVFLHKDFGKILFSLFDILITIACKELVMRQLSPLARKSKVPSYCAQMWLYNPMSIAISTRGNADSVPCFFIIMSLFFLRTDYVKNLWLRYSFSGILLGLSIHLRLYPIAFSFPMFLSLGAYDSIRPNTTVWQGFWLLLPNRKQFTLTVSCMLTVAGLTYFMYQVYGYEFLFETYLYHLFRKDTRHNFSVMFYYQYLTMDELQLDLVKIVIQIFEALILFMISLKFGVNKDSLPFALFCQAVVLVVFNTVVTSQYFIWFLSLLPLVAHCFDMSAWHAGCLVCGWIIAQGAWLYYAFLLEFKTQSVFFYVWLKSLFFFIAHIYILVQMIKTYKIGYGFGLDYPKRNDKKQ